MMDSLQFKTTYPFDKKKTKDLILEIQTYKVEREGRSRKPRLPSVEEENFKIELDNLQESRRALIIFSCSSSFIYG